MSNLLAKASSPVATQTQRPLTSHTCRNDNDNDHGHNQLGNEDLAAALDYAGYDHTFILGAGYHNLVHSHHLFPDTLRWLFCGGEKPAEFARPQAQL